MQADVLPTTLYGLTAEDLAMAGDNSTLARGRRLLWSLSNEQQGWAATALGIGSGFASGLFAGAVATTVVEAAAATALGATCLAAAPVAGAVAGIMLTVGTAYAVSKYLDDQAKEWYAHFQPDQQLQERFETGQPFGGLAAGLVGGKWLGLDVNSI